MKLGSKTLLATTISGAAMIGALGGTMLNSLAANADTATPTVATTTAADTATTTAADTANSTATTTPAPMDQSKGGHVANGITETLLTGDTATKARAAALAAEPGGTVLRAETDAEGAAYEVHMTTSDGSQVTVKLDANYKVTSTDAR